MWKKVSMFDENLIERGRKREENVYYRLVDYLEIDEYNMWREGDIDYLEDMKKEDWENNISDQSNITSSGPIVYIIGVSFVLFPLVVAEKIIKPPI